MGVCVSYKGLQAELVAANKESEYLRKRLQHLEDDLQTFREKNNTLTEQLEKKSGMLKNIN